MKLNQEKVRGKNVVSIKDVQEGAKVSEFTRLFQYIEEVGKLIGRDRALRVLENLIITKRLNWLKKNKEKIELGTGSINQAYETFFYKYLKLTPEDVEIVEKNEDKLVTKWRNFCPVLEACKALGLDTREICRKCYEKPVQIFLNQINPKLKFRRNYEKIRPHADFCEEIIEMGR